MTTFGKTLKAARKKQRITLRELGAHVNLSVGYLSDIEREERRPPAIEIIKKMEERLGLTDNRLQKIAKQARNIAPTVMAQKIKTSPRLCEVLMRAGADLSNAQFKQVVKFMESLQEKGGSS